MSNLSPADPQPTPLSEFELNLIKQEYFFRQTTIEDYWDSLFNRSVFVSYVLEIVFLLVLAAFTKRL